MSEARYDNKDFSSRDNQNKDPSMKDVADLILESLEEEYKTEEEPFEVYAQKLKSHIHTDAAVFRHRFTEGYAILMAVLHKTEKRI